MSGTILASPSMSVYKVLSNEALTVLAERGDGAVLRDGVRAVSNSSYATSSSLDSEATVLIPDELESVETLEFLELEHDTARTVYAQFRQRQSEFPHRASILRSAQRHLDSFEANPGLEDEDWIGAMNRIGLTKGFQARLMDPDYKDMRLSGSLKEWVSELFNTRYEFLNGLDAVVKGPPSLSLGRKTSSLDFNGKFSTKSAPPISPRTSSSSGPKLGTFKLSPQPQIASAIEGPSGVLDEHLMLFKGAAISRLEKVHLANGHLNFAALSSSPPGDFSDSFRGGGLYFTKQEAVAWRYVQWTRKIVDGKVVPVGILQVAVPRHLLVSIKELHGDEWRQFVWANRREDQLLPESSFDLENYAWLVGPITHQSTDRINKLSDKSEMQMWKLEGQSDKGAGQETASQHYTASVHMLRLLNEHCVGKIWITAAESQAKEGPGTSGP